LLIKTGGFTKPGSRLAMESCQTTPCRNGGRRGAQYWDWEAFNIGWFVFIKSMPMGGGVSRGRKRGTVFQEKEVRTNSRCRCQTNDFYWRGTNHFQKGSIKKGRKTVYKAGRGVSAPETDSKVLSPYGGHRFCNESNKGGERGKKKINLFGGRGLVFGDK